MWADLGGYGFQDLQNDDFTDEGNAVDPEGGASGQDDPLFLQGIANDPVGSVCPNSPIHGGHFAEPLYFHLQDIVIDPVQPVAIATISSPPNPLRAAPIVEQGSAADELGAISAQQQPTSAGVLRWSRLFCHIQGVEKAKEVPMRQAHAITEYIKATLLQKSTNQTTQEQAAEMIIQSGSICAIGSNHKVSQKGHSAVSTNLVRSLFDRSNDPHHPESSGFTVQEFQLSDNQKNTHSEWARLNLLCHALSVPIRFGVGWTAQRCPRLYFGIVLVQTTPTWSRAYKIKPDLQIPQPLGKKDIWIVKAIQRCDPAATVFWGSWGECNAEQDRREETGKTAIEIVLEKRPSRSHQKGQTVDELWEGLNTEAGHPYQWKWTDGGSHTRTYSFALCKAGSKGMWEHGACSLPSTGTPATTLADGLVPVPLVSSKRPYQALMQPEDDTM